MCGFLHLFPSKKGTNQWGHICIKIHSTEARELRRSSLDNGAFGLPARSACKDIRWLRKLTICFLPQSFIKGAKFQLHIIVLKH